MESNGWKICPVPDFTIFTVFLFMFYTTKVVKRLKITGYTCMIHFQTIYQNSWYPFPPYHPYRHLHTHTYPRTHTHTHTPHPYPNVNSGTEDKMTQEKFETKKYTFTTVSTFGNYYNRKKYSIMLKRFN